MFFFVLDYVKSILKRDWEIVPKDAELILQYADQVLKQDFYQQVGKKTIPVHHNYKETWRHSDMKKGSVIVKKNQIGAYIKRKFAATNNNYDDDGGGGDVADVPLNQILVDSDDVYYTKLEEFRRHLQEALVHFMRDYLEEVSINPPKKKQRKPSQTVVDDDIVDGIIETQQQQQQQQQQQHINANDSDSDSYYSDDDDDEDNDDNKDVDIDDF